MNSQKINVEKLRQSIVNFDKLDLNHIFVELLGWEQPAVSKAKPININEVNFDVVPIAHLAGIEVFQVKTDTDTLPKEDVFKEAHSKLTEQFAENVIVFTDKNNNQCWYWAKKDKDHKGKWKIWHRPHYLLKGQTGDLFIAKILALYVDFDDYNLDGRLKGGITEAEKRLRTALDVERVIKKFYTEYRKEHLDFAQFIQGIDNHRDREWYAGVLLNRLMFIYFLQKKGFIDSGNTDYLKTKLEQSRQNGENQYYSVFLNALFFDGFAKPEKDRTPQINTLIGKIVYLNGGLFLPHRLELNEQGTYNALLSIPDNAFDAVYTLFDKYSWNLNDLTGEKDDEMNPDVLGYIFEKYINQKEFGAYYTKPEITEYLCQETIYPYILLQINHPEGAGIKARQYDTIEQMLIKADAELIKELIGLTDKGKTDPQKGILSRISILDPACGSGAFLVAALKTLIDIYSALYGRIDFINDPLLKTHKQQILNKHPSLAYYIKKKIISDNLFGVDINAEAVEIARLRLFIYLVASVRKTEELEPLPNIDFNLMAGNSLVGLLSIKDTSFALSAQKFGDNLFGKGHVNQFAELIAQKQNLIRAYKQSEELTEGMPESQHNLLELRNQIDNQRNKANAVLNQMLLEQMDKLKIKYERATWDEKTGKEGKALKENLSIEHINALNPFHWGYEFSDIMAKGGFDLLIGNPPWETLKPQDKEFFDKYSELVTKNKMTIKDFETEKNTLLQNENIRKAYLSYLSIFPHQSAYFRSSPQYKNQSAIVNGKKTGTDINLYKLFTEQFYNLMKPNGFCGIVIPSGIYTDLGTKGLRDLLFQQTQISGLFCFENRKSIFENVDSRFKFATLNFQKGGQTESFRAAFMRHEVADLELFRNKKLGVELKTDFIRRLSPDSFSVMEFKNELEMQIAGKMLKFPLLGEKIEGTWNIKLTREFDMTNDSHLFRTEAGEGRLPLFTGKMFHQFSLTNATSGYWIDEKEGQSKLKNYNYKKFRWVHRRIASNTNERTLITSITPPNNFTEVNSTVIDLTLSNISYPEQFILCCLTNSFVIDWMLRQKVTTTLNMFYIYQLPIARLSFGDSIFELLVSHGARLICTDEIYAPLWEEVMGEKWTPVSGLKESPARLRLRAEMDACVAHLYGLTTEEFQYILTTFPLVDPSHKEWALHYFTESLQA